MRMPSARSRGPDRRPSRLSLPAFVLALLPPMSLVAPAAVAAEAVRFNEVTVGASEQPAAFQDAMRVVLVRATGRREAGTDPAFQALVADAARFVQIYRPARAGSGTQVTFDAAALERAIAAAGGSVWPRERPVALVVVVQPPPGADPVVVRRALEDAGAARGLPLRLVSASSAGLAGLPEVGADVALAAAQRLGADVALVGRGDGAGWRWAFHAPQQALDFEGGVAAGVDGAADALAAAALAVLAQPESDVVVEVRGVEGLADYAEAARLLAAATGVRFASLLESTGSQVSFRVRARGGADGLAAALAQSARLRPIDATGDRLVFELGRQGS
jgi:hypothetical protein